MPEPPVEPYVFIDRAPAAVPRRWTVLRGRKPALLLVDRDGAGLDHPLASEGFEVYRTTGRESALELLRSHPSMLMALVQADLPGLDLPMLIRDLRQTRPGLWVALLCDPADRTGAAAAYDAGAVDLFYRDADPFGTVVRLIRGVPRALRLREEADLRLELRRRRGAEHRFRRLARRLPVQAGFVGLVLVSLGLGAAAASATRSWHEARDLWNARVERFMSALEASRPPTDRIERQLDRWSRSEQAGLQIQSERSFRQEQREEDRLQDLLRRLPGPRYSVR